MMETGKRESVGPRHVHVHIVRERFGQSNVVVYVMNFCVYECVSVCNDSGSVDTVG